MPIRRAADPANVIKIWDAIRYLSLQNQPTETSRIAKFILQKDGTPFQDSELYIKQAIQDNLITPGETSGQLTIITQELPLFDGKDWYCFECHLAGDVIACKNCHRVFHEQCIAAEKKKFEDYRKTNNYQWLSERNTEGKDRADGEILQKEEGAGEPSSTVSSTKKMERDFISYEYDSSLCCICNMHKIDVGCGVEKDEMNYLLKFVLYRIRAWLPNTITHTMAEEDRPSWLTDAELTWRANQLFYEHKDMSVIEVNLNNNSYSSLVDFLADVLTIQHNVTIFHGVESQEQGATQLMMHDTIHDLNELKICVDCYRHSNEKINSKWFCLPCRIPHELVWAKQKGYPYWPAKVIKRNATQCDVRFFGGKHERALLSKTLIKPISVPKESVQVKGSAGFNKAYAELCYHKQLLENPAEIEKLKAEAKPKKKSNTRPTYMTLSPKSKGFKSPINNMISQTTRKSLEIRKSMEEKKRKTEDKHPPLEKQAVTGNVIAISDGEEEEEFPCPDSFDPYAFDDTFEQVSSSTESLKHAESRSNSNNGMQQLDHPYCDAVEKMRRKLEDMVDPKDIIKCAMDCMQAEIDKITNENNEHLKRLFESHNAQISETKKKQWCYNCEQDAIYHCCWNTAYCSQICQQQHWQAEHKKVCRRKR